MKQQMQQDEGSIQALDGLARERQPGRDLWAGIETRISPPQRLATRRSWLGVYALAASVSAAVLAGVLLRGQPPAEPQAVSTPPTMVAALPAEPLTGLRPYSSSETSPRISARTLRTLRSESRDNAPSLVAERAEASGLMKATYAAGREHGASGQQAILRAHLKLVAQAEREVRRALAHDPQSASLQSLLTVAQEKRATLTNLLVHEPD